MQKLKIKSVAYMQNPNLALKHLTCDSTKHFPQYHKDIPNFQLPFEQIEFFFFFLNFTEYTK